ncbi:MAG TPA: SUMF1/EgtB/PvdO family nonheme iron enzyme [Myxococcota bacterium]|nr:SUMF1/EgtB/PvdO family nonheme iron enzyme [Myxococcota bacterium]
MMCALGTTVPAGCHGWCPVGTEEVHEGFVSFPEYPDNRKMHSCRLPDGRLNGPYEVFSEDGALLTRGHYREGRECGTWVSYNGQGNEIDRLNLEPCEPVSCPNPAPGCQDEMVELNGYWIDSYEASRFDATECSAGSDNASGACSQASVLPWSGASWSEARAACERVGKRLCSLGEWQDACDGHAGAGGRPFPFGEEWSDSACNTWDAQAGIGGILPTGALPACKTPSGVFDLVGNVSEYIGSGFACQREPCVVAAGGSYDSGEAPDWCNAEPLEESLDVDGGLISSGFRCCR